MTAFKMRLCWLVGLCVLIICIICIYLPKTRVQSIDANQNKAHRFASFTKPSEKTSDTKPIVVLPEELSGNERQQVSDSKAAILSNYQALEILRTTVLSSGSDAGGSSLAVLIKPPTELESLEAAKFSRQYFENLSSLGAKTLEMEVSKLAASFNLDNESKYITMFISPPNEDGIVNTTIQTSSVDIPDDFIEKYRQDGSASYGKTSIHSGPEPAKDWRFSHIFRIADADASAAASD